MFPFANELLVTVVGGVLTAIILGLFTGRSKNTQVQSQHAPNQVTPSGPSAFGQFMHLVLSVAGGLALSFFASRFLFKSGILEKSMPMRLAIIVGAIVLVWFILHLFRGKR